MLLDLAGELVKVPNTGRLADDLVAYVRQFVLALAEPHHRRLTLALCAVAAEGDEEATIAVREFWLRRFAGVALMFERAVARGELQPGLDHYATVEGLVAPAWFRALVTQAPADDAFITRCVAAALAGSCEVKAVLQ